MMYVRWFLLLLINGMSFILNYPLAPFAVLFASEDGWLPKWLWWFQTPDNSLDGDGGWKAEHRPYKIENNKYQRWVNRVSWLYRNSMYGFAFSVLGAKTLATDAIIVTGDIQTSNRPLHNGWVFRVVKRNGVPIYWQLYYVKQRSDKYCYRINLGWKLWQFKQGENTVCQYACSPSAWMGFEVDTP